MTKRVEVVIVSWNSNALIARCIESVRRNTAYPDYGLTVVDNASSDGTPDVARAASANVTRLETNVGWVGALNHALTAIEADYYFFLNPDAFVEPGWLTPLVAAMNEDASIGFATSKFLNTDGTIQSAGYEIGSNLHFSAIGAGQADQGQHDRSRIVPFCGGMMLMRRTVFEDVGAFDSIYGLGYYEDSDYQLRALRAGWRIRYVPESRIVHLGAESFGRVGNKMKRILTENRLKFMTVHYPLRWLIPRLFIEATRPIRAPFRCEDPVPFLAGAWGWLLSLPDVLQRRADVARLGPCPSLDTLRRQHDV